MKKNAIKCLLPAFILCLFYLSGCGHPPEPLPVPDTGSVRIAVLDSLLIDSINVTVDNIYRGRFRNPYLFQNLIAGDHKFSISTRDASTDPQIVSVLKNRITKAFFSIETIGPYVNRKAPNFTLTDIDGNQTTISSLRGKVILLAFFEHT